MESINPYRPDFDGSVPMERPSLGTSRSVVIQIRIVSILLIVHGIMLLLMGFMLVVFAILMPSVIAAQANRPGGPPGGPTPVQMQWIMLATYGSMSASALIPGVLQVLAGLANLRLRKRVLGIVALSAGLMAVFSCYCIPTSIGLAVYGLIIYLNPSARKAFALSEEGRTFDEIVQLSQ